MHPSRIFRTAGFRLAALYAGLFGASVLVLFGVVYWIAGGALRQQFMTNVESEVSALAEDHRAGGLSRTAETIERRLASGLPRSNFYLLTDSAGREVAGNLPRQVAHAGWQELPIPPNGDDTVDTPSAESSEHRVLALGVMLEDRSFLLVGEDMHGIVEVKEVIIRAFAWAFGGTVVLGVAGGVLLSLGFLHRIDAINRTSRAIIHGKLSDRVPTRGTGDELDRLAGNLNEMLDQVQALMESLRQVSSDIAHDLRTPLGRLRQQLEGARLTARGIEDYEGAIDQAIADTDGILATFSALLRIAQIEAGTRKAAFTTIALSDVFQLIADTYGAVAEDRGQTLAAVIEPGILIGGDRELITQMLANLIENAIRHTPGGTRIEIRLNRSRGGPQGVISDNGPGIPSDDREKVFQRFYRLERSRSSAGSGLGLALVAAVADIHGIFITLSDNRPGLKVLLDFTATASQPEAADAVAAL